LFSLWACRTASRTELQAARFADDAARLLGLKLALQLSQLGLALSYFVLKAPL